MTKADGNKAVFDSVAATYTSLALMPAERTVLVRLRDRLRDVRMLDIGVGTGRTGYTFAPLVRRYVGLDYSEQMVVRARRLLGESDEVSVVQGDARDLSGVGGPFDFVLFSFNGIDAMGHDDRLHTLRQVREVLSPDGEFLFSTHSMNALPLARRRLRGRDRPKQSTLRSLYAMVDSARYAWRISRSNRALDLDEGRRRGWILVRDNAHGFSIDAYYIDPAAQLDQLDEVGLELIVAYDAAGREVDPRKAGRDPWLNYLVRRA